MISKDQKQNYMYSFIQANRLKDGYNKHILTDGQPDTINHGED